MDPNVFKTDNIIGIYPDQIDEEGAWKVGCATARFLRSLLTGYERGQEKAQCLCVGRDSRTHSEVLTKALIKGMNSTGTNVIDIGMIDTPQLYFAINHFGTCGGVQITASHSKAKYCGFKISGLQAKPVGADTGLKDIKHIAMALLHTRGTATGSVQKRDLTAKYKNHVLKFLKPNIKKLKVAVDACNGMAGKMIPAIFSNLPIEIIPVNFEHTGKFKHEPNPLIKRYLSEVKKTVKQKKCDFGVCFDGDAERIVIVDEKGSPVGSDLLASMMVPYFLEKKPGSVIVYDLRSSRVVMEEILKNGGTPRRERVGHSFMKKAMRDSHAVFGVELSGHFYYSDNYYNDSALITLVHVMNIVSQAGVPISHLVKPLKRYSCSGELNFEIEDSQAKIKEIAKRYSDARIDHLDGVTIGYKNWWFNCRSSKNEPFLRLIVETTGKEQLAEKLNEITGHLGEPK
jgi:phosphomannomutase